MNEYKVHINNTAIEDIKKIHRYISTKLLLSTVADGIVLKIKTRISILKEYPYAFQVLYKYKDKNKKYRRLIEGNYSIIYYILEKEKRVVIVHIYYNKRNFLNL